MNVKLKRFLKLLIITICWLGLWQILSVIAGLELLLPTPLSVLKALSELVITSGFWLSVSLSLLRITLGFSIGVIAGTLTGATAAFSKTFSSFLAPIVYIVKATPVASFIILAIVWLKTGNVPSFITMLMVFPIVWTNVKTGFGETDKHLLEMSDAFNVGNLDKLKKIYIPSVKPYFISAVSTGMGLAWKAGIAAEVICNPKTAIGSGIYNSKIYLDTPQLFAWTTVVIIMSIALEKIMCAILKRGKKDDKN